MHLGCRLVSKDRRCPADHYRLGIITTVANGPPDANLYLNPGQYRGRLGGKRTVTELDAWRSAAGVLDLPPARWPATRADRVRTETVNRKNLLFVALLLLSAAGGGCVRRTLTVSTSPSGALVYLNDEEVGRSPVTVPFTWYGDYDIIVRKTDYQALRTHARLHPPWYQVPPLDLVSEALIPVTLRDKHELSFTLQQRQYPTTQQLLERAASLRQRTLERSD